MIFPQCSSNGCQSCGSLSFVMLDLFCPNLWFSENCSPGMFVHFIHLSHWWLMYFFSLCTTFVQVMIMNNRVEIEVETCYFLAWHIAVFLLQQWPVVHLASCLPIHTAFLEVKMCAFFMIFSSRECWLLWDFLSGQNQRLFDISCTLHY